MIFSTSEIWAVLRKFLKTAHYPGMLNTMDEKLRPWSVDSGHVGSADVMKMPGIN